MGEGTGQARNALLTTPNLGPHLRGPNLWRWKMPCKDKETQKECDRRYYLKNRERKILAQRIYRQENADKIRETNAHYRATHPEQVKEYSRRWRRKHDRTEYDKLYSLLGPLNPDGEIQWLNRAKAIQRHIRRVAQNRPLTPKQLQAVGSEQELISRLLCQP